MGEWSSSAISTLYDLHTAHFMGALAGAWTRPHAGLNPTAIDQLDLAALAEEALAGI